MILNLKPDTYPHVEFNFSSTTAPIGSATLGTGASCSLQLFGQCATGGVPRCKNRAAIGRRVGCYRSMLASSVHPALTCYRLLHLLKPGACTLLSRLCFLKCMAAWRAHEHEGSAAQSCSHASGNDTTAESLGFASNAMLSCWWLTDSGSALRHTWNWMPHAALGSNSVALVEKVPKSWLAGPFDASLRW